MRNLTLTFALALMLGCGGSGGDGNTAARNLIGTWTSNCHMSNGQYEFNSRMGTEEMLDSFDTYVIETYKFKGSSAEYHAEAFFDEGCTGDASDHPWNFLIESGVVSASLIDVSEEISSYSVESASDDEFNQVEMDWDPWVAECLTAVTCPPPNYPTFIHNKRDTHKLEFSF